MRIRTGYSPEGHPLWSENVPSEAMSSIIRGELVTGGPASPAANVPPAPGNADALKRAMDARYKALGRGKAA